jgi:hypothetical protein
MRKTIPILLSVAAVFCSSCQRGKSKNAVDDIDAYMAALSARAVDRAKSSYGLSLDYSPDSVKSVERILGTKYDLQKSQPMTESEIVDAGHLWGAYIGEVMKRIHPARWNRDSVAGGKDSLPIVFLDTHEESYPCAWVYHRLKNGDEDNVWMKFYFVTQPGGLKQYFPDRKKK